MIQYQEFGGECLAQVMALYEAENWNIYSDREQVRQAFARSLYTLGAFEDGRLVGFIRCIGDGGYDLFVSDLLVEKEHRRQGIGRALLDAAMKRYAHVENFVLMTGLEEQDNRSFYRAMGMKEFAENRLVGYIR